MSCNSHLAELHRATSLISVFAFVLMLLVLFLLALLLLFLFLLVPGLAVLPCLLTISLTAAATAVSALAVACH